MRTQRSRSGSGRTSSTLLLVLGLLLSCTFFCTTNLQGTDLGLLFLHPPRPCNECHASDGALRDNISACHECHGGTKFTRKYVHAAIDDGCDTCHDVHNRNILELSGPTVSELCASCHEEADTHAHPTGSEYNDPRTGQPLTCVSCHEPHSSDYVFMLTHNLRKDFCVQCHSSGATESPPGG
jgi:predicted CXXCH cytochrome family protein